MFKITNETDLLESFRPFERGEVEVPRDMIFPATVKSYYAWVDSSGTKTFLVFSDVEKKPPIGVVFKKSPAGTIAMCDWCHSVGEASSVGLLSATASENRRVAVHVCSDLSCEEKIRGMPGANDFPKAGSERERVRAVLLKMSQFVRQNLF